MWKNIALHNYNLQLLWSLLNGNLKSDRVTNMEKKTIKWHLENNESQMPMGYSRKLKHQNDDAKINCNNHRNTDNHKA